MFARRKISLNPATATLLALLFASTLQADQINWRHSVDAAKVEASSTGKLVLLHFYTPSCGPCKKLERDVFSQPQIAAAIEQHYVPVKLNADDSPAIANAFRITRVPSEVVLNSHGNVVQKLNCPLEPGSYGAQLTNVAQHYQSNNAVRPASAQTPVNSAYAGLKIGQSATKPTAPQQAYAVQPQVTANPYFNSPPPPVVQQPAPPVAQQARPSVGPPQPQSTANRYGNRYAQATPPAPAAAQPHVAQAPAIQPPADYAPTAQAQPEQAQPPITPTPTYPPTPTTSAAVAAVVAKPPTSQEGLSQPTESEVWPPKLPAGTPPLAFEGYCPVSLKEAKKWVRGKKEFGAIHRGRTYLFVSEAHRGKFLATAQSSDAFSPVFSGNDPVKLLDDNQPVAGSRKYGFEYRNAFYLFSSKETMEKFARQPDRYSAGVRQAMVRMDAAANGTVQRNAERQNCAMIGRKVWPKKSLNALADHEWAVA